MHCTKVGPFSGKNRLFAGKSTRVDYFLYMEKKISLDLAKQHYYIQIPCALHEPIFNSVFAMDFILQLLTKQSQITLYGYCFFPDKLSLLLYSKTAPSQWLDNFLMEYNQWQQNIKNGNGYLFDDENRIQILIQPKYLAKTLRHVHNLPVSNKLCSTSDQYLYSSYHDYSGKQQTGIKTETILAMLSPHCGQRSRRFHDYMTKTESTDLFEQGNHDYYLALTDSIYLTRALSSYATEYDDNIEEKHSKLWQLSLQKLKDITQLEDKTLLGISRHHSLPDAHFLLAWLFVEVAHGPLYFAAKKLSIDETALQLNIKSITLHHTGSYLRYIANSWEQLNAA